MSNEMNTTRRGLIKTGGTLGLAALAGCSTQGQDSNEENEGSSANTTNQDNADQELEQTDVDSQKEVERSLKALAYALDEDLSQEGFESDYQVVRLTGEEGDNPEITDDGEYRLDINLDTGSLLHGSGILAGDQDLYTAAEVGAMHKIFEYGEEQLEETKSLIEKRLNEFSEHSDMPEDYSLDINVEFSGARDSHISFEYEHGEETLEEATTQFLAEMKADDQRGDGHSVGYDPGEYENLKLLEAGRQLTFHIDNGDESVEHTIEYDGGGDVLINGDEYAPREEDGMLRTQVLDEEIRVNQFNTLHSQEIGDSPEAVELEFEYANVSY